MSKHNSKYIQLVKTAKELFWKYGIKRVTIEEICSESAVSKMTFYKFFANKTELAQAIIDKEYEDGLLEYKKIMGSDRSMKLKVSDLVRLKLDKANHISHEFLNDWINLIDNEANTLNKKVEEMVNMVLNDLIMAQKRGEIREDIKPEFISYFLNHLITLSEDPALNSLYPEAEDMIMELINFFFHGILPRSES